MVIRMAYGNDELKVEIPDDRYGGVIEPAPYAIGDSSWEQMFELLNHSRLAEFLTGAERVLIVVNDSFRATPTHLALQALLPFLERVPEARVVIATGLHRAPADSEITEIVGRDFPRDRFEVLYSDAKDDEQFFQFGRWQDGTPIRLHKSLQWADKTIVIGSVEPHYFAGFTGGPKSFMPGLAHHTTIEANHRMAVSKSCVPGSLTNNPVAKSIRDAASFLRRSAIFSIQFVLDSSKKLVDSFVGDLWDSYERAVAAAVRVYMVPIERRYRLAVAVHSKPLDRNLYQLQKSYENASLAVEDGGTLVVVSACNEGIGNDAFFELATRYPTPESILKVSPTSYTLGYHKLYRTAQLQRRINIYLKSELQDDIVEKVYLRPARDVETIIKSELDKFGEDTKVMVINDAGHVVPYLQRAA